MPSRGQLELALRPAGRARERALLVAEQLAFQQRFGQRRAGDRHERLAGAIPGVVDGAGHQFLAGAALPADQHRAAQARNLLHQLENRMHLRAFADDVVKVILLVQPLPQDGVFPLQVLDLDDALHQQRDFRRIARLDDILLRAFFHRRDGRIHGGIGGDDNDGGIRVDLADLHHGLDAIHAARHFQVDEIDGVVRLASPWPAPRRPEAAVSTR